MTGRSMFACLLAAAFALSAVGCKKDEDKKPKTTQPTTPPKSQKPPPKKMTPEARAKRLDECLGYFSKQDADKFGTCYAENAR